MKKVCSFEIRIICSTKPDIRPDTGYKKRPDIRYNPKENKIVRNFIHHCDFVRAILREAKVTPPKN